ncbi:MAG: hypothetical protein ABSE82_07025 [Nitrososphaerales archaeon]|jgi:hypothetical protein
MAKSRGGLVTILLFLGGLFAVSGLIFTLQGLGIVGPGTSFMFKSSTWIYEGSFILVGGLGLIAIGFAFRPKSRKAEPQAETLSEEKSRSQN